MKIEFSDAGETGIPAIQRIYAHYVSHGLASFEEVPQDADEMYRRFVSPMLSGLSYLIAKSEMDSVLMQRELDRATSALSPSFDRPSLLAPYRQAGRDPD